MRYDDPYEQIREMNRHFERLRELTRGPLDEINETFRRQQELYRLPLTRLEEFVNEATRSSRPIKDSMQLTIAAARGTLASTETLEAMPGLEAVQTWKSHLQESVDSAARTIRGGLDLREMNLVADGLYGQARRYIELEDSIQKQLGERLQAFERAGIIPALRQFTTATEDWRQTIAEVAGRLSTAFTLARGADFEELNRRVDLLRDFTSGSAVFGMLAKELFNSARAGALTPALAGGFGGELLDYFGGAEEVDSEEAAEEYLKRFMAWLLDQAQRLPGKKLTIKALEGLLGIVVTLLIEHLLFGNGERECAKASREAKVEAHQARQASEETSREVRELKAWLTERLDEAPAKDDDAKEYVVIKAAKLRMGPGKEFEPIRVLPPNLQIEEIGRKGDWSHVRYFDYVDGELREGWISAALLVAKQDDDQS